MKMKKLLCVPAFLLATATFASCAGIVNVVNFNKYWQSEPNANITNFSETLKYGVSYDKTEGLTNAYSLAYSDGVYTTKLETAEENGKAFYRYETNFSIKVTYTLADTTTQTTFEDSIYSWVTFEKEGNTLQPIASHKEIATHSPTNATQATALEDCYTTANYVVDVTYNGELTEGKATVKNLDLENQLHENTFEIDDENARYLDNEQLYLAMRGVNNEAYSAPDLLVYAPFTVAVQSVKATFTAESEGSSYTFKRNGEEKTESVLCNKVTLELNTNHPGSPQTLWITKRNNSAKYRNLIMKMDLPLAYGFGSLIFTLQEETVSEQ